MPAMVLIFGFMTAYVNFLFFGIVGRRLRLDVPKTPLIYDIRLPKWLGALFIVGVALMLYGQEGTMIHYIGMNLSLLFTLPVLFQGLALAVVFMRQYIKSFLFYILLFIVVLTNPFLTQIATILGLFDIFFDYRGWLKERGN
jgi:uncharacterized protein YybS (DUF2232 family)